MNCRIMLRTGNFIHNMLKICSIIPDIVDWLQRVGEKLPVRVGQRRAEVESNWNGSRFFFAEEFPDKIMHNIPLVLDSRLDILHDFAF